MPILKIVSLFLDLRGFVLQKSWIRGLWKGTKPISLIFYMKITRSSIIIGLISLRVELTFPWKIVTNMPETVIGFHWKDNFQFINFWDLTGQYWNSFTLINRIQPKYQSVFFLLLMLILFYICSSTLKKW